MYHLLYLHVHVVQDIVHDQEMIDVDRDGVPRRGHLSVQLLSLSLLIAVPYIYDMFLVCGLLQRRTIPSVSAMLPWGHH